MASKKLWKVEYDVWSIGICVDYIAADTFEGCLYVFEEVHENSKSLIGQEVCKSDIISISKVSDYVHYKFE